MGLATALPYRSLRLTSALSARRRDSNGEAVARIPLKNKYLFILATHTTTLLLQTKAERRRRGFGGGRWDWLLRSLSVAPLNACPLCSPQGHFQTFARSCHTTFCFHYHSYKQACRVIIKTKGVDFSTPSCFVLGGRWGSNPRP